MRDLSARSYTTIQAQHASDTLITHWKNGTTLRELPETIRPQNIPTAYQVQSHIERLTQHPLWGWKIAATSKHGQHHINVDRPLAGRILTERVTPYGDPVPLGPNRMLVAELEFVFRMGTTLPPGRTYPQDEVMDAVSGMFLGSEIPDSRYEDFTAVGAPMLIADDACADRFVLGPEVQGDWRGRDLAGHEVRAWVEAEDGSVGERQEGCGGNVLGDPRVAITWIANELSRYGVALRAGEFVTTGTCVVPVAVRPGVRVVLDYGDFGRMEIDFVA